MKGKLVTVLFIIVFILLVAVIISLLTDDQGVTNIDDYRLETTQTDSNILADLPSAQPAAETVPPTMLPLPTQAPTPTPPPTPTPTPPPTPVPIVTDLGSGSFVSHSGNKINIIADYKVTALNETQVRIDVDVDVESYSLENRASRSLHVSLGGEFVSIDVPAINYGGGELMRNDLGSASFTVDLPLGSSNNYTLAVEWQFGGVYFNTPVPVIECGGNINIVR